MTITCSGTGVCQCAGTQAALQALFVTVVFLGCMFVGAVYEDREKKNLCNFFAHLCNLWCDNYFWCYFLQR